METILSGLLGIMIGAVGTAVYFYRENSVLQSQILDKQTIIKLIKEHMAKSEKSKPRRNYRRKKSSTKKYEKAS